MKPMSIKINKDKCERCGKCVTVCPGSLIEKDSHGKAFMNYPKDCWGCTACLKECDHGAINYYLGADLGGQGARMYTKQKGDSLNWIVIKANGEEITLTTNSKESNKY